MQAKDLRIGDRWGNAKDGAPLYIRALHELCPSRPSPHVHVVTSREQRCLPFDAPVSRDYDKAAS